MNKYLNYIRLLYNWKIKKETFLKFPPFDISIELTNSCNFKCKFCLQSNDNHFEKISKSILNPDKAKILLSKLRNGGIKTSIIHWTLDGEPFLNKEIPKICEIAIDYGFKKFIFSTNGYFATTEKLKSLPNISGINYQLCIDYCSDKNFFEINRGVKDSWERIKNNIINIINDKTLSHMNLQITDISGYISSDPNFKKEKYNDLRLMFSSKKITFRSRKFHNMTGGINIPNNTIKNKSKYNFCPYPWISFVIASNGDVVSCCRDIEHKSILGNLFEDDFQSIWNGIKYQNFRKNILTRNIQNNESCKNCDLPYDKDRFSLLYIAKTAIKRFGLFK